jgi:hypothetical protein
MEHIALMEKTIGPFPPAMVAKSPSAKKYFHSADGAVRFGDLDRDCARHVRKAPSGLHAVVKNPAHASFLALLRGLLCLDPADRVSAYDALRSTAWLEEETAPTSASDVKVEIEADTASLVDAAKALDESDQREDLDLANAVCVEAVMPGGD